jgi:hypothetical protein
VTTGFSPQQCMSRADSARTKVPASERPAAVPLPPASNPVPKAAETPVHMPETDVVTSTAPACWKRPAELMNPAAPPTLSWEPKAWIAFGRASMESV